MTRSAQVITDILNIRPDPSKDHDPVGRVHADDVLLVDADDVHPFRFVPVKSPIIGYTYSEFIRLLSVITPLPTSGVSKRVTATTLNVRSGPGTNHEIVGQLTKDMIIQVDLARDTGSWIRLTGSAERWVSKAYLAPATTPPPSPAPPPSPTPVPPPSSGFQLPMSALRYGGHGNPGGWRPNGAEMDVYRRNNINYVTWAAYQPNQQGVIADLRIVGVQHFIIRAAISGKWDTAANFAGVTLPILKQYADTLGGSQDMMILLGNEPNLVDEGWTHVWQTGQDFAAWWLLVAGLYRANLPGCRIGFAAMSPGGDVPGIRMDERKFVAGCSTAIQRADFVAVHNYWGNPDGSDLKVPVQMWRQQFGSKPLIITESGPGGNTPVTTQAVQHAHALYAQAGIPATFWIIDGSGAFDNADWKLHNITINPNPSPAPIDPLPSPTQGTDEEEDKWGIHIEATNINHGLRDAIIAFCRRLKDAGHELALAVVIDDIWMANELAALVKNVLFRSWPDGEKFRPELCLNQINATSHANWLYDQHWPVIRQLRGVKYVQFRNERSIWPGNNWVELQLCKRCDNDGLFKCGMFGESVGTPKPEQWVMCQDALRYGAANGHAAVIHPYGQFVWDPGKHDWVPCDKPVSDPAFFGDYGGRFVQLSQAVPADCQVDFILAETGSSDAKNHGQQTVDDFFNYNKLVRPYRKVKGFGLYGFGNSIYDMNPLMGQLEAKIKAS